MSSDKDEKFREMLLAVRHRIEMCRLNHRHFDETKARLKLALEGKWNIVMVVGTTGVGKGVLAVTLTEELNRPVKDDPFQVRAIASKSSSSHGSTFSWSEEYLGVLEATGDPLPEEKVDRADRLSRLRRGEDLEGLSVRKGSPNAMRRATLSAIEDRGVKVAFIDEAQNLVLKKGGYGLGHRLRVLRDLSMAASGDPIAGQERGCKIVLMSTPEILEEVIETSSEIVRRMKIVEFPRYTLEGGVRGEEFQGFRRIVHNLLDFFPEEHRPRLSTDNVLSLQMDSVGVIDVLITWFVAAINLCWFEGAGRLEWRHFEMTALSNHELEKLSRQCREDERILWKVLERDGCGLARQEALKEKRRKEGEVVSVETAAEKSPKAKGTRVGEQNPVRHRKTGS